MSPEWVGLDCWPLWDPDGDYNFAHEWSVRDARVVSLNQAKVGASWHYSWNEIRVWKRYVRDLLRWEQWDEWREECGYVEDDPDGPDGAERDMPDSPPDDWQPNEELSTWMFCHRSDPGAVPVWVVGCARDKPPAAPEPMNETWRRNALAAMTPELTEEATA